MSNDKWYKDYIEGIDVNNIKWINITDKELIDFYIQKYIDENGNYVFSRDFDNNTPIGMYYIRFSRLPGFKYVLGLVENNIGKNTIVSSLSYIDDYVMFNNQNRYITYLSTIETNKYFRNMGLCNQLLKNIVNYIPFDQNILYSVLSPMGRKCNLDKRITNIFRESGFELDIRSDTNGFDRSEYYEYLVNTHYIKIKKR